MTETTRLTKDQALALFDGNQAALGRALGVTRQAINKLGPGKLPEWMDLKIRFVIKPGEFSEHRKRHRSTAASAGATAEATPTVLTGKVA